MKLDDCNIITSCTFIFILHKIIDCYVYGILKMGKSINVKVCLVTILSVPFTLFLQMLHSSCIL